MKTMRLAGGFLACLLSVWLFSSVALAQSQEDVEAYDDGYGEEEIDVNVFFAELAPYGDWIWTPEFGWVWKPGDMAHDWRPYSYGHWVYTDYGWTWSSYFDWGWGPFHYGRWSLMNQMGWVWVPGTVWAPAWVMWRHSDIYVGWSPLLAGYSLWYGWAYYPIFYDHWVFLHWRHFCDHHPYHHYVGKRRRRDAFRHTYFPRNCRDRSGRMCNRGPKRDTVAGRTNTEIPTRKTQVVRDRPTMRGGNQSTGNGDDEVVRIYRPRSKTVTDNPVVGPRGSKDLGVIHQTRPSGINRPAEMPKDSPLIRPNTRPSSSIEPDRGVDSSTTLRRPVRGETINPTRPKTRGPDLTRPAWQPSRSGSDNQTGGRFKPGLTRPSPSKSRSIKHNSTPSYSRPKSRSTHKPSKTRSYTPSKSRSYTPSKSRSRSKPSSSSSSSYKKSSSSSSSSYKQSSSPSRSSRSSGSSGSSRSRSSSGSSSSSRVRKR